MWERDSADWLPTNGDRDAVKRVQNLVTDPGKMATWIAAPRQGIGGKGLDLEYARLA